MIPEKIQIIAGINWSTPLADIVQRIVTVINTEIDAAKKNAAARESRNKEKIEKLSGSVRDHWDKPVNGSIKVVIIIIGKTLRNTGAILNAMLLEYHSR